MMNRLLNRLMIKQLKKLDRFLPHLLLGIKLAHYYIPDGVITKSEFMKSPSNNKSSTFRGCLF